MSSNNNEYECIISLTNEEAITDLEGIYEDLLLLKAQLRNHHQQLGLNELEEKLHQQLEINELYGDTLSDLMKQLATKSEKLMQLEKQHKKKYIEETTKVLAVLPYVADSASTSDENLQNSQTSLPAETTTMTLEESPTSSERTEPITVRKSNTGEAPPVIETSRGQSISKTYLANNQELSSLGKTFGNQRRDLLNFCKKIVRPYGIPMYEFSTSWRDGHAYCALIHHYKPHLVDAHYIHSRDIDGTLHYVNALVKSLGLEFGADMVKFYKMRRPSYVKTFGFVLKLIKRLETSNE